MGKQHSNLFTNLNAEINSACQIQIDVDAWFILQFNLRRLKGN